MDNLKDSEGRYEVKLPWMQDKNIPKYRDIAERRLERTTKLKLERKYDMVFEEWLKLGCYLPHRGIFRENSTTKVRPVFDASNKKKGFPSLNDCQEKGPNTLELIPSLLVRFREKRIGVISDIKRAFLQISIAEEDRDYL
ncbi:pro-Pol polyprotein [Trichonephila clavipes]|nr:pro-Pol polyprotein [Trichonephila clavipes]